MVWRPIALLIGRPVGILVHLEVETCLPDSLCYNRRVMGRANVRKSKGMATTWEEVWNGFAAHDTPEACSAINSRRLEVYTVQSIQL